MVLYCIKLCAKCNNQAMFIGYLHRLSEFLSTAWPHDISDQVLSSQSIVSSEPPGRAVHGEVVGSDNEGQHGKRPVFFVLRSQTAEGAISHSCKQGRKRRSPVRRRLNRTHAVLGRTITGGGCRCWG